MKLGARGPRQPNLRGFGTDAKGRNVSVSLPTNGAASTNQYVSWKHVYAALRNIAKTHRWSMRTGLPVATWTGGAFVVSTAGRRARNVIKGTAGVGRARARDSPDRRRFGVGGADLFSRAEEEGQVLGEAGGAEEFNLQGDGIQMGRSVAWRNGPAILAGRGMFFRTQWAT